MCSFRDAFRRGRIPGRIAVLAGLAEQKPQLLQALVEDIFRRHFLPRVVTVVRRVAIGLSESHDVNVQSELEVELSLKQLSLSEHHPT